MSDKLKQVKIIKCSGDEFWYKDSINNAYTVFDYDGIHYKICVYNGSVGAFMLGAFILKDDCIEIDTKPGTVIKDKRWFSILDKDLPEVQALIGKEVYFSHNPYDINPDEKIELSEIKYLYGIKKRTFGFPFIAIPEKAEPRIPDANTPRGTRVRVRDIDTDPWVYRDYTFYLCDESLKYPFIIKCEDGEVICWKYCEIIEGGKDD